MAAHLPDERQPPLYFAGRREELGVLGDELRALCATGLAPGGLRLVTGVHGVGKTQLAAKYLADVGGTAVASVARPAISPSAFPPSPATWRIGSTRSRGRGQ